jgi:glycosyltransferase involved in cell wall biosynthesis
MEKISEATVLMATYNGEKWLETQLQSILKQKNVKIKLVVQDDNSEDNTQKIIKKFQKKNNIDLNINKKNQRSASLNFLNLIIKTNTKSDYYAFSDQDDIWYSNKLSRAIKKLDENKCEAYSSNVSIISNKKMTNRLMTLAMISE